MPLEFATQLPGEGTALHGGRDFARPAPASPFVPTVHANFRYLTKGERWWFGGGADLTPYYPTRCRTVIHFHRRLEKASAISMQGGELREAQEDCDDYFFSSLIAVKLVGSAASSSITWTAPGRIFSLSLALAGDQFLARTFRFWNAASTSRTAPSRRHFKSIAARTMSSSTCSTTVERCSAKTGGRIESILMSLPPKVRWEYQYQVVGSGEAELTEYYLNPRTQADGD